MMTRDDIQSHILPLMYGTSPKLCPYSTRTLTIFTGLVVHLATTCHKIYLYICEHHVSYTSDKVV